MVSVVCLLLEYDLTMAVSDESMKVEAAMIFEVRWVKFETFLS